VVEISRSHSNRGSSKTFNCYRIVGNHQMYEVLDDTAAQTILAIESGDSIRRVAQHLHTPYETVRQAVNRLEDAGYVSYDDPVIPRAETIEYMCENYAQLQSALAMLNRMYEDLDLGITDRKTERVQS